MVNTAQTEQDEQDFGSAYAEDPQAAPAQSEDDAFGLTPDVAEDDGIPNSPEEATEVPAEAVAEPTMGEEPGQAEPVQPQGMSKEEQRLKSWEGRLKARVAELKAAGHAVDGDDAGESDAQEADESGGEQQAEAEVQKLQGMSPDEALKTLANDFGEDFASMLATIIDAKVAQASGVMGQSVDDIINDIVDTKAKAHFETIADRHPDFMDVAGSGEFKGYIEAMPEADKAQARRVIEAGSAREINKLLDTYKQAGAKSAPADEARMDAAEGVRSTGMRLPTQPGASSDYAAAWDEFKD